MARGRIAIFGPAIWEPDCEFGLRSTQAHTPRTPAGHLVAIKPARTGHTHTGPEFSRRLKIPKPRRVTGRRPRVGESTWVIPAARRVPARGWLCGNWTGIRRVSFFGASLAVFIFSGRANPLITAGKGAAGKDGAAGHVVEITTSRPDRRRPSRRPRDAQHRHDRDPRPAVAGPRPQAAARGRPGQR